MLSFILLQVTDQFDPSKIDLSPSKVEQLMDLLFDKAVNLGEKILIVVVVYFIGSWIIRLLNKLASKLLHKNSIDVTVQKFVGNLIKYTLNILLFIIIIGILGVQTTSFAAIIAAAGLAVGMAMKDNLSNFAGGVMLLVNKPFKIGDRIVAQGQDGTVTEIGILYTVMLMADGRTVYQPNGPLSTGSIINYSDQKNRRVDITFNVNYGNDADSLKKELMNIVTANTLVLKNPAPFVGVTTVYNGNFDITIRAWVNNADYSTVNIDLNETVYRALKDKGIYAASPTSIKMVN